MSEEFTNQQSCGGKKRAMLAYGLCAVKQESHPFNGCVETVVAEGRSQAEAGLYCNGG